jgi:hypothetical protein
MHLQADWTLAARCRQGGTGMQRTALARPLELLLIEDNEADIRLLQEVLKESSVPTHLAIMQDGFEALRL